MRLVSRAVRQWKPSACAFAVCGVHWALGAPCNAVRLDMFDQANKKGYNVTACAQCERREKEEEKKRKEAAEEKKRKEEAEEKKRKEEAKLKAVVQGDLGQWFRSIGFEGEDLEDIVARFIRPGIEVKNLRALFALDPEDIDDVLEGLPLGTRKVIKKSIQAEH